MAARRLGTRWLLALERETGATAHSFTGLAEGAVVNVTADGRLVVHAAPTATAPGSPPTKTLTLLDGATGVATRAFDVPAPVVHADVSGERLVVVHGAELGLYSLTTGRLETKLGWTHETYRWATFVSPTRVVAVGENGFDLAVRSYDVTTGNSTDALPAGTSRRPEHIARLDARRLVVDGDQRILVLNLDQPTQAPLVLTLPPPPNPPPPKRPPKRPRRARPPSWDFTAVAASPSGVVAAATRQGTLLVWRLPATTPSITIPDGGSCDGLALNADGQELSVVTGFGDEVRTYELARGTAIRSRPAPGRPVSFARDGAWLVVGGGAALNVFDRDGVALWPVRPPEAPFSALALTRSLAWTTELRRGVESRVRVSAYYHGRVQSHVVAGYTADLLALSPSGRRLAAVVGRAGHWWDLEAERQYPLAIPEVSGFPDRLELGGESILRLTFERPAASYRVSLGEPTWHPELTPGKLTGFHGTRVSSRGVVALEEDGKLVLAPSGTVLVPEVTDFAFSGDGALLFAGAPGRLSWFDATTGAARGERATSCTPEALGVDFSGRRVAFGCGRGLTLLEPGDPDGAPRTIDVEDGLRSSSASVHVSPSGHLIAIRTAARVRLYHASPLASAAELTLPGGELLAVAGDGTVAYGGEAPPLPLWCRLGARLLPFGECQDRLTDDALLDALLE